MGLFKGSASISRYEATVSDRIGFWDFVDERVRMFAFRDIEDSADEVAVGWVSATDFMDTAFQYASYALDPYVVMGLRIDRRKLPAGVLQKYFRMAVAKAKAMREDGVISRAERETLKEKVKLDLLTRIPPGTQVFDVVWDTAKGTVWFGGASRSMLDIFEDYFRRCFQVELMPRLPYFMARSLLPGEENTQRLEHAAPWDLSGGEAA